jgi:hypothetical protein
MRRIFLWLASLAALGLIAVQAAGAGASTSTVTLFVPFTANQAAHRDIQACLGEDVSFNGNRLIEIHETTTSAGQALFELHVNPQGVTATGLTTGNTYAVSGHIQDVEQASGSFTFEVTLTVTSPGPSPDFTAHFVFHVTVNAKGDVTSDVAYIGSPCS